MRQAGHNENTVWDPRSWIQVPSWTFRQSGFVNCNGGRVTRVMWRCRVGWDKGYHRYRGRATIRGNHYEGRGRPFYWTVMQWQDLGYYD